MRKFAILCLAILASPLSAQSALPAGIWTNTEDAYFAEEERRAQPDWLGLEVADDGRWRRIDAFGQPLGDWSAGEVPELTVREDGQWLIEGSKIRKARPFICWVSVRKTSGIPDGSDEWSFQRGLKTFDQGGRIAIPGEGVAPDVTLRLRHVTWARDSENKPSLVLYVHRDDPDRADSYAWTSPDASLIGINLRWVQAICSPAGE